jgi:hypothetical protein
MHKDVIDNGFEGMSLNDCARMMRDGGRSGTFTGGFRIRRTVVARCVPDDDLQNGPRRWRHSAGFRDRYRINASSSLLDVVKQAQAAFQLIGRVNSNGPGSLGHSSPDAAAPWPSTGPQAPVSY